jgi:hypothetical protein
MARPSAGWLTKEMTAGRKRVPIGGGSAVVCSEFADAYSPSHWAEALLSTRR